jgi:hypothetical protein
MAYEAEQGTLEYPQLPHAVIHSSSETYDDALDSLDQQCEWECPICEEQAQHALGNQQ